PASSEERPSGQAKMRSLREKRFETRKISHNPEVSRSNRLPTTKIKSEFVGLWFFIAHRVADGINYQ
ncbi:MAG TPA: hypothetical protein PLQ28_07110, partial [Flexilinea sp.]|nr:hypothetical protein [Flexilinea sp.]